MQAHASSDHCQYVEAYIGEGLFKEEQQAILWHMFNPLGQDCFGIVQHAHVRVQPAEHMPAVDSLWICVAYNWDADRVIQCMCHYLASCTSGQACCSVANNMADLETPSSSSKLSIGRQWVLRKDARS